MLFSRKIFFSKDINRILSKHGWQLKKGSNKQVKNFKGEIASRGKSNGKVKIILTRNELAKMKNGNILVAPMTSPWYLPAIKKATAIITDEGGVTCHAAIVSRELNIPCIIGTKIATQVLKDGDLVEVDANKGDVKLL